MAAVSICSQSYCGCPILCGPGKLGVFIIWQSFLLLHICVDIVIVSQKIYCNICCGYLDDTHVYWWQAGMGVQQQNKQVNKELWKEALTYGDMQLLPFVDYYELIVFKTLAICMFAVCDFPI